jgi:P27 family predicted phage terminase small subunit
MSRPGRAPQPTKLKLVHGNPGKRPLNTKEPKPPRTRPERPDWLTGEARTAWDELAPLLDSMGVLTSIDGNALARYCKLWGRWVTLSAAIEKHGEVYPTKDKNGNPLGLRILPQVRIVESLSAELRQLDREFGLTPSARSRIDADPQTVSRDPLQDIIDSA